MAADFFNEVVDRAIVIEPDGSTTRVSLPKEGEKFQELVNKHGKKAIFAWNTKNQRMILAAPDGASWTEEEAREALRLANQWADELVNAKYDGNDNGTSFSTLKWDYVFIVPATKVKAHDADEIKKAVADWVAHKKTDATDEAPAAKPQLDGRKVQLLKEGADLLRAALAL